MLAKCGSNQTIVLDFSFAVADSCKACPRGRNDLLVAKHTHSHTYHQRRPFICIANLCLSILSIDRPSFWVALERLTEMHGQVNKRNPDGRQSLMLDVFAYLHALWCCNPKLQYLTCHQECWTKISPVQQVPANWRQDKKRTNPSQAKRRL